MVLQGVVTRDAKQSISLITAQKQMVQGGGFDVGKRTFIIDRKDVPRDFVLRKDDWIVFDNKHYDIDTAHRIRIQHGMGRHRQGTRGSCGRNAYFIPHGHGRLDAG